MGVTAGDRFAASSFVIQCTWSLCAEVTEAPATTLTFSLSHCSKTHQALHVCTLFGSLAPFTCSTHANPTPLIFFTTLMYIHLVKLKLICFDKALFELSVMVSPLFLLWPKAMTVAITTRQRLCRCCRRPDCGTFKDCFGGNACQEMFKNGLSSGGTCLMPSPASVRMTRTLAKENLRQAMNEWTKTLAVKSLR